MRLWRSCWATNPPCGRRKSSVSVVQQVAVARGAAVCPYPWQKSCVSTVQQVAVASRAAVCPYPWHRLRQWQWELLQQLWR